MAYNASYHSGGEAVGTTSTDATATITVTTGDLIFAIVGNTTTTDSPKVTDNLGNQLKLLGFQNGTATGQSLSIYAEIAPAGVTSITASHSTNDSGSITTGANKLYLNAFSWTGGPSSLGSVTANSAGGIIDAITLGGSNVAGTSETGIPVVNVSNSGALVIAAIFLNNTAGANTTLTNSYVIGLQNPNSTAWFLANGTLLPAATGNTSTTFTWTNSRKWQSLTISLLPTVSAPIAGIKTVVNQAVNRAGTY
jgi:hypothetical protein